MTLGQRVSIVTHAMARTPEVVLDWLSRAPTTNIRILMTCGCIVGVTLRYVLTPAHCANGVCAPGWEPSLTFLGFLLALAGVDTAHFIGKRKTDAEYVAAITTGTVKPRDGGTS